MVVEGDLQLCRELVVVVGFPKALKFKGHSISYIRALRAVLRTFATRVHSSYETKSVSVSLNSC